MMVEFTWVPKTPIVEASKEPKLKQVEALKRMKGIKLSIHSHAHRVLGAHSPHFVREHGNGVAPFPISKPLAMAMAAPI